MSIARHDLLMGNEPAHPPPFPNPRYYWMQGHWECFTAQRIATPRSLSHLLARTCIRTNVLCISSPSLPLAPDRAQWNTIHREKGRQKYECNWWWDCKTNCIICKSILLISPVMCLLKILLVMNTFFPWRLPWRYSKVTMDEILSKPTTKYMVTYRYSI